MSLRPLSQFPQLSARFQCAQSCCLTSLHQPWAERGQRTDAAEIRVQMREVFVCLKQGDGGSKTEPAEAHISL